MPRHTSNRSRSSRPARPRRGRSASFRALAASGLAVLGLAAQPAASASASGGKSSSSVQLLAAPPWLTGTNSFDLNLKVNSPLPAAELGLSLELYPPVTGRSDFEQTLTGTPTANVLEALPIPLSDLHLSATSGPTSATITLKLPVTTASFAQGTQSPGSPELTLDCLGNSPCQGVYPLQVALVNRSNVSLSSFTTYAIYAPGLTGALPLRVAWLLPFGQSPSISGSGQPVLDTSQQRDLATTAEALSATSSVSVDLETSGETMVALANDHTPDGRQLLTEVQDVAATPNTHQFVRPTYAPSDASAFAAAGMSSEFSKQLAAARVELAKVLPGAAIPTEPWVFNGSVDPSAVAMLQSQGVTKLVVPENNLQADNWPYSATEPFKLELGSSSGSGGNSTGTNGTASTTGAGIDAIAADTELATHFTDSGDQALNADQLLADLAEIYFELPYAHATAPPYNYQPRSVVLLTPEKWTPQAAMLQPLLQGLAQAQSMGILQTTTLSGLFKNDPAGADGEPAVRQLTSAGSQPSSNQLPVSSVAAAYSDVQAYSSLVPARASDASAFNASILAGEGTNVSVDQQTQLLGSAAAAIAAKGQLVSLPEGRTVTLTSSSGQIPITIESRSPAPLHVELLVSDPQLGLRFPQGTSLSFVVSGPTTVEHVQVSARTSGDFPLDLELLTPTGAVVLSRGSITIRSTAISGLAIGLSVGALVLLLGWWVRSSRRRRRAAKSAGEGGGADVAGGSGGEDSSTGDVLEPDAQPSPGTAAPTGA